MGNVLKMDKQQQIKALWELGYSRRRIARTVGCHRESVKRYCLRFEAEKSSCTKDNVPEVPTDLSQVSKADVPEVPTDSSSCGVPEVPTDKIALPSTQSKQVFPHRQEIVNKHLRGLSARRIYQDLVEEVDFSGSYDSIKRYVRKLHDTSSRYYSLLSHPAGEEAQVDFGTGAPVLVNGSYRKTWLFKMTLSFSGHSYEELVFRQDLESFIRCHEHAFRSFGGVPATIKLDNLKSGVLQASLYEPELNPLYLHFAQHWCFAANPCAPYKPEHKGVVERDVRYTKDNALKDRKFDSLEEGNQFLRKWNKRWARTRIHGSHKMQVWKLFCDVEKPVLKALPERNFSLFKIAERKVDVHGHLEVGTCFYSVPHRYIGQRLPVHYNSEFVRVYNKKGELLCQHRALIGKRKRATRREDLPSWKPLTLEQEEIRLCSRAKHTGPNCHKIVYTLLSDTDNPLTIRRARGVVYLDKKFSPATLELACYEAIKAHIFTFQFIKGMCQKISEGTDRKPAITQNHDLIRSLNEYQTIVTNKEV